MTDEEWEDRQFELDEQLDEIYTSVNGMMRRGTLHKLNNILAKLDIDNTSVDLLLGYLVSTLPVKSKLKARSKLLADTEKKAKQMGVWEPSLLGGLD